MPEKSYSQGALVRASAALLNAQGSLADATSVILRYRPPGTSVATLTLSGGGVVRDATGMYHADIDTITAPGEWGYHWTATGGLQAAGEGAFSVDPPPF